MIYAQFSTKNKKQLISKFNEIIFQNDFFEMLHNPEDSTFHNITIVCFKYSKKRRKSYHVCNLNTQARTFSSIRAISLICEFQSKMYVIKPVPCRLYFEMFGQEQDYSKLPIELFSKPFLSDFKLI